MKMLNLALVGALAFAPLSASAQDTELSSLEDRFSYAFGMNVGEQMRRMQDQEINVDMELFVRGLRDIYENGEGLLTQEQLQQTIQEFQQQQQAKQMAKQQAQGAANQQAGEAFLAANASKDGVVVTDSGLQYKVLTQGSGPKPTATDTVTVHYRGTLIDGTEFDSSYSRNQPTTFQLSGVIPGWTEGLQLMAEGSKFEFYIPSNLAYGPNGPPSIGPNATLIFEVELLKAKSE